MRTFLAFLILLAASTAAGFALKKVASLPLLPSNTAWRNLVGDTDRDGLGEIIHRSFHEPAFEIAEYRSVNQYAIVLSRASRYPADSVVLGNLIPHDIGDFDRDGKIDILGEARYDTTSIALCIFESRDSFSYPDSLVWWTVTPNYFTGIYPSRYADLDRDSAIDIVTPWWESTGYTAVFENVGNDRESLVCTVPVSFGYTDLAIDDYDQNGRMDYTFKWGQQDFIVECIGDNSYQMVCSLYTGFDGVNDRFAGHDVDQNGKPEWFELNASPAGGGRYSQTLCQFEATSEHQYACDTVDTASSALEGYVGYSLCADVDGDSLEEIVWSSGTGIQILKATGPHQYERVSRWPLGATVISVCNAADFNGNGYKEIYVGSDPFSWVLEIDCIRVRKPDTNRYFEPGDTCLIRWEVYTPPRCDSVSLFLRGDTNTLNGFYRLDTIVTGLSPSESMYTWVVPDTTLDSARILAIAYGPGWQFDESDMPFRIAPTGMQEVHVARPLDWALSVWPNPVSGKTRVNYDVPRKAVVYVGLYDATGRLAEEYASGVVEPGRYQAVLRRGLAPGVYFCRMDNGEKRISRKVVLTE